MTKIEWTEETWNPIVGCRKVSPGCRNCYAERMAKRLKAMGLLAYQEVIGDDGKWNGEQAFNSEKAIQKPLRRRKPTRWFVDSMSDLFLPSMEFNWYSATVVWNVAKKTPQHTYQILTKHPETMKRVVTKLTEKYGVLPNVWLGVSIENQAYADKRIPALLDTPAAVRFVSAEPLLGPVYLPHFLPGLDWVIVGGESGPGARPMHPAWALSIRDQCIDADVPFFFKQWGEWRNLGAAMALGVPGTTKRKTMDDGLIMCQVGKKRAGRLLDGREWNEMPQREEG